MKVTVKGQVTIPRHIRRFLGISAYSEVDFTIQDDEVVLKKVSGGAEEGTGGEGGKFRKLRGLKKGAFTTAEWMKATRGD